MDSVVRRGGTAVIDMRQPKPASVPVSRPVAPPPPQPAPQPQVQPLPPRPVVRPLETAPVARPVARPAAPVSAPVPRPVTAQQAAPVVAQTRPRKPRNARRGLKVFFQTLLALVVIIGVATGIVVLYLHYYQ